MYRTYCIGREHHGGSRELQTETKNVDVFHLNVFTDLRDHSEINSLITDITALTTLDTVLLFSGEDHHLFHRVQPHLAGGPLPSMPCHWLFPAHITQWTTQEQSQLNTDWMVFVSH